MLSQRLAGGLAVAAAAAFHGVSATAVADTTATVTVIHAIPGLPEPVTVFANGNEAFSFDYRESVGPLALDAGTYDFEVQLQGMPVLMATADLEEGINYTAIAHLTYTGGDPGIALSLFENNVNDYPAGRSRVTIRHTADAPAVDISVARGRSAGLFIEGLANPDGGMPGEAGPVMVRPGNYRVKIFPAGGDDAVFATKLGPLSPGYAYIVYAIGSLAGESFELYIQAIELMRDNPGEGNDS